MSPTKLILAKMQENEKKYNHIEEPLIQRKKDSVEYREAIAALSETYMNLQLCKSYLLKISETTLNKFELRNDIQEFLKSINKK